MRPAQIVQAMNIFNRKESRENSLNIFHRRNRFNRPGFNGGGLNHQRPHNGIPLNNNGIPFNNNGPRFLGNGGGQRFHNNPRGGRNNFYNSNGAPNGGLALGNGAPNGGVLGNGVPIGGVRGGGHHPSNNGFGNRPVQFLPIR